jgi:primosomal protein N' (replication factor Y)
LDLLIWCQRYYHAPIGEIVFTALPLSLRKTRQVPRIKTWQLTSLNPVQDISALNRAKKQKQLIKALLETKVLTYSQCKQLLGSSYRSILNALQKKAWIETLERPAFQAVNPKRGTDFQPELTLTDEQQHSVEQFKHWAQEQQPKPILLHGITGSGKTEVYLRMISDTIRAGQQALILVPEIGLTTQLLDRFQNFFPQQQITTLNSSIARMTRLSHWIAVKSGDADIIIGTRSAVFAAFKSLGVIIIDEEHDLSFKQHEGFRYHARDLAVKRAYDLKIPIVLGSATPALESLYNSHQGKYHYLHLSRRPGTRTSPEVLVQSTHGAPLKAGLSEPLLTEVRRSLERNQQVMLFLNRRGFAPTLFCQQCGWHSQCRDCDSNMTLHAKIQKLRCHHCGYEEVAKQSCPDCSSMQLDILGQGTQRVEVALKGYFPKTAIIRIDRDSIRKKGQMDEKLQPIRDGKAAILLGTQMLAKGHDFPQVTLVGILDIDQALFSTDFRAPERLAQLIIQVSGRSGRGKEKGKVLLQTSQAKHPLLVTLLSQGYLAFANSLLEQRQLWSFPPYSYQALIRAESLQPDNALQFLETVKSYFSETADLTLMGPMPSLMERRAKWYRAQLLLVAQQRAVLHSAIEQQLTRINKIRKKGKLRWVIDVDPLDT